MKAGNVQITRKQRAAAKWAYWGPCCLKPVRYSSLFPTADVSNYHGLRYNMERVGNVPPNQKLMRKECRTRYLSNPTLSQLSEAVLTASAGSSLLL